MMTAYVAFTELKEKNISLDEEILVSKKAWKTGGSKMFIEVGKKNKGTRYPPRGNHSIWK